MRPVCITAPVLHLACGLIALATATLVAADQIPPAERRSGYDLMSRETKAMQDDDTANPATLWVLEGETLWSTKGPNGKSCADCHGDAAASMKGVAARYPAFDAARGKPVDLEGRINICRKERHDATPFAFESRDLLALTAYVARQSRDLPIVQDDERMASVIATGRKLFEERKGQLNLSCAQCHDDNWGRQLAGSVIPQAHPTGYPVYRLEWQSLGSLQRRLRNCLFGMRAETFDYGAPDAVALEAFLMWRARGMKMDAPGVRP
jgi:L-cysteine S-thiosulfotransferase